MEHAMLRSHDTEQEMHVAPPLNPATPTRCPGNRPRSETIAIHGGYEAEPTTKAVAVPIYQTVAYEFDSADHGAALFNLEVDGHRYSRISNPTTTVLEERVAALEGGVEALSTSSGQAAL